MEKSQKYTHEHIFGPRVILYKEDLGQLAELFKTLIDFAPINML
jgi:hypothetical protein